MTGQIYFAEAAKLGAIKVGFTTVDVASRLCGLQTGCPDELKLLGAVNGERRNEQFVLRKFGNLRLSGEWMANDPSLLEFISEALKPGFEWPSETGRAVAAPGRYSNLQEIIESCGGAVAIAEASDGQLGVDAVYKWQKIGVQWWHWRMLMRLSDVTADQLFAANEQIRASKAAA